MKRTFFYLIGCLLLPVSFSAHAANNSVSEATEESVEAGETGSDSSQTELQQIDALPEGAESDASDAEETELEEAGASDLPDFLRDSSLIFRSIWYSRDRHAVDLTSINEDSAGDINVNVLGSALDFSSGYLWDLIGLDLGVNSNLKIGSSTGQSEVLYYDYVTNEESSEIVLGRASLKFKLGSETNGFKANVGYTPINVGTIGTSAGLHSHGYRGLDAKYTYHDIEFGYGWADQFHNEWDKEFRDITNSWDQNRAPYEGTAEDIDFIHSIGARYAFGTEKKSYIDVGVGQGKDYRTNQQIAGSHTFDFGLDHALSATAYYFQGQYDTELSGIADPTNEWHTSIGFNYTRGPWLLFAGYGITHAPDSGELNFRLTPWANSDNRNFIQTWGQLDDYVWDGEQVIKLGVDYDIGTLMNLPGLVAGVSYNYGWDLVNLNSDGQQIGTSKLSEVDAKLTYTIEEGKFKGFGAGVYAAWLGGDNDFYGKPNRNDIKFIASYEVELF